jgi:hypothetical protein
MWTNQLRDGVFYALAPTRDRTQYLQIVMQVH